MVSEAARKKIAAVGIERHAVRIIQGAYEFRDGILREHKATVAEHVIAGIEQDEYIGATDRGSNSFQSIRLRARPAADRRGAQRMGEAVAGTMRQADE